MKNSIAMAVMIAAVYCVMVSAAIIHVPGDYPTIQQAINSCNPYDTISLGNGTFTEFLTIDKPLALIGAGIYGSFIEPPGDGNNITITSDHVTIEYLQVRGGDAHDDAAILLNAVDSCLIKNCYIWYDYDGIVLWGGTGNVIRCNYIDENLGSGVRLSEDPNAGSGTQTNFIENNMFELNQIAGVNFDHIAVHHYQNIVRGNMLMGNGFGVLMITSQENEISYNDIQANSHYGISISMCMGGGENNLFHHNNFIDNDSQAYDMYGNNYWFDSENSRGNYWTDYAGADNDSNGIGDEPRVIAGAGGQDSYPLMRRLYATVSGTVTDINSLPVINVQVLFTGTNLGVFTDAQGHYRCDSLWPGYTSISFVKDGYQTREFDFVPITLSHITTQDAVLLFEGDVGNNEPALPSRMRLLPNYPNPFNAKTTISFDLQKSSAVELTIYDITGVKVARWIYQSLNKGRHDIVWDAGDVSSGIYFARLKSGAGSQTRRMALLK